MGSVARRKRYVIVVRKLTVRVVITWLASRCSDGGVGHARRDAARTQQHATGQLIHDNSGQSRDSGYSARQLEER